MGEGIYKSTDAGKSWSLMGLEKTGRIGRIVIDPQNPDIVLAAAMGHAYAATNDYSTIKAAVDGVDIKLIDIEEQLIQRKLTGQGQDGVRWPARLLSKIGYLANGLSGSDFGPTSQQREVQALFTQQLSSLRKRLDEVLSKDLETFNKLLRDRGIQNVITRTP